MIIMEQQEFCKMVKQFIADEQKDSEKYNRFADMAAKAIPDIVMVAGIMMISMQETTHRNFWNGVYENYCKYIME